MPPSTVSMSCRRNWNRVATPKSPPPLRIAKLLPGLARQPSHVGHIIRVGDPDDGRGSAVDPPVVDGPRLVVSGVIRRERVPVERAAEAGNGKTGRW